MSTATGLEFKIQEMAQRIKTLREIVGLTPAEMALKTGITEEEYLSCEAGESDLNFAFLYRCALALNVDVTDIGFECQCNRYYRGYKPPSCRLYRNPQGRRSGNSKGTRYDLL